MKTQDGSVAYLNSKPVDGRIDDTVLEIWFLAIVDASWEWELRIKVNNPPIIFKESTSSIRCHIDKLISLSNRCSSLEEDRGTIRLISIGDTFTQHIEKHIILSIVKLTLNICTHRNCINFQDKIYIYLLYIWILHFCYKDT